MIYRDMIAFLKLFGTILLVELVTSAGKIRFDNFRVYRVRPDTQKSLEALGQLETNTEGIDFWKGVTGIGRDVDVMVPPHLEYRIEDIFRNLALDSEIIVDNVQELIDRETVNVTTRSTAAHDWKSYQTLEQIYEWMRSVAAGNPETVSVIKGGSTFEGRDILGVRIRFKPGNENKSVFIESNIHAREWITSAVTTYFINALLTSEDPDLRSIAESHDWYIFPVTNPDGYVYSHLTIMVYVAPSTTPIKTEDGFLSLMQGNPRIPSFMPIARKLPKQRGKVWNKMKNLTPCIVLPVSFGTKDRMWRKTRTPYHTDPECYGADPNRNWGYKFNTTGGSDEPCSMVFRGPKAFSEKCTNTLSQFISTIGKNLEAYISLHSYSQLLLLPYSYTYEHLDNYDELLAVGKEMVTSLAKRYGTRYGLGTVPELLYLIDGDSMDWVKGTFHTRITYGYELRDEKSFILPPEQIIPTAEETIDSFVTMFKEFEKL